MLALLAALVGQRVILPPAPPATVMERRVPPDLRVSKKEIPAAQNGWPLAVAAASTNGSRLVLPYDVLKARDGTPDANTIRRTAAILKTWRPSFRKLRKAVERPHWL